MATRIQVRAIVEDGSCLLLALIGRRLPPLSRRPTPQSEKEGCDPYADPQGNAEIDLGVHRMVLAGSAPVAPFLVRVAPLTKASAAVAGAPVWEEDGNGEADNQDRAHGYPTPCGHERESRFPAAPSMRQGEGRGFESAPTEKPNVLNFSDQHTRRVR